MVRLRTIRVLETSLFFPQRQQVKLSDVDYDNRHVHNARAVSNTIFSSELFGIYRQFLSRKRREPPQRRWTQTSCARAAMKTPSPSRDEGREHGLCIDELVKSLRLVSEVCVRDGFVKFEYATYSHVTEEGGVSEAAAREGADELTLRGVEEGTQRTFVGTNVGRRRPLVDEDWHAVCPAICKGTEGEDCQRLFCKYAEMNKAVNFQQRADKQCGKSRIRKGKWKRKVRVRCVVSEAGVPLLRGRPMLADHGP